MFQRGCCRLIGLLILFMTAGGATGAPAASGTDPGQGSGLARRVRMENISTSLHEAAQSVRDKKEGNSSVSAKNFAAGNEAGAVPAKPKTKRIIIGVLLISLLIFTFANLASISNNSRICTNCGYTGSMKAVILSKTKLVNSVLVFLVGLFPVLLFYYAEKGRFFCPRCGRTSANVTVKSRIREMEL